MAFVEVAANSDSGAYEISNSLRFNDDDSASLTRTPSSAGNRKTFTFSTWVKRSKIGGQQTILLAYGADSNLGYNALVFTTTSQLALLGWSANWLVSTALFRDPAAWYHIVLAVDTTDGTADDRVKLYVNGSQLTAFGTRNNPSQNDDFAINDDEEHNIGSRRAYDTSDDYFDGYLSETYLVDGSQLAPTLFGETDDNGIWIPKKYTGSYGTNGFKLEYKQTGTSANASGMGADTSGNTHHWTLNGLAAVDVCTDTPTNNFATLNPLITPFSQANPTFSEGNCKYVTGTNQPAGVSTMAMENGKWYWEIKKGSTVDNPAFGVVGSGYAEGFGTNSYGDADSTVIQAKKSYHENGDRIGYGPDDVYKNGSAQSYGSFDSIASGDIFMVALDMDNNKIWFGNNGTWLGSGDPANGSNEVTTLTNSSFYMREQGSQLAAVDSPAGTNVDWEINFGNPSFSISSGNADDNGYGNFEYDVPTGFYALCSKNLAEFG